MFFFKLLWITNFILYSGSSLITENYVVNNFAPERCGSSPRQNEYVIGVDGYRDVIRYKVVNKNMTRSFGDSCCPTNTDEFEIAVGANKTWTYYLYNWNARVSKAIYENVSWKFIENILENETWERHRKNELEDKVRSFIRKPLESYRKLVHVLYGYMKEYGGPIENGGFVWANYKRVTSVLRKFLEMGPFAGDYYRITTLNGGWDDWFQMNKCDEDDETVYFARLCQNPLPINNGTLCDGGDGYVEKFNTSCKDLDVVMKTKFNDTKVVYFVE